MEVDLEPLNIACDIIPNEVIFQIASLLPAKDVLNLATTCKKLTKLLNNDDAWESKVLDWIAEQDVRSGILGSTPENLRVRLGLQTLRATYQALVLLKIWPNGLWYSADSSKESEYQPEGTLVWISDRKLNSTGGVSFTISNVAPCPIYSGFQFPHPREMLKWMGSFVFGFQIQPKIGIFCPEVADTMIFKQRMRAMQYKVNSQDKSQFRLMPEAPHPRAFLFKPDGSWVHKRAEVLDTMQQEQEQELVQQPSALPAPPPGLYYAIYGSHGLEVLQLERTEGTNYTALKLKGDRNVPACQLSFRFNTSTSRPGPYRNHRDDPYPSATGPRPLVSFASNHIAIFHNNDMSVVNLDRRPVRTVFPNAQGQINRFPGYWNPEWVQATVVVYEYDDDVDTSSSNAGGEGSERAVFSVIFEDQGEESRHVMDFFQCPCPASATCS